MTKATRIVGTILTIGSVLLASACGDGDREAAPSTATSSTTTASSSPAHTSATAPSDPTNGPKTPSARSRAMVEHYFKVSDRCLFNPQQSPMTCFDSVAASSELNQLRNTLSSAKTGYTKQIGTTRVVWAKQLKVDLANKPKETPPSIPTVTYSVCYDVSKVNIVDSQGKSIVPPNRKPRAIETIAVVNYRYPSPAGWRVGYTTPTGKSC